MSIHDFLAAAALRITDRHEKTQTRLALIRADIDILRAVTGTPPGHIVYLERCRRECTASLAALDAAITGTHVPHTPDSARAFLCAYIDAAHDPQPRPWVSCAAAARIIAGAVCTACHAVISLHVYDVTAPLGDDVCFVCRHCRASMAVGIRSDALRSALCAWARIHRAPSA